MASRRLGVLATACSEDRSSLSGEEVAAGLRRTGEERGRHPSVVSTCARCTTCAGPGYDGPHRDFTRAADFDGFDVSRPASSTSSPETNLLLIAGRLPCTPHCT